MFGDKSVHPRDYGPFDLHDGEGIGGWRRHRAVRVPAGETVVRQVDRDIRGSGWFPFWTFTLSPSEEGASTMISALTVHRQAPNLAHAPLGAVAQGTLSIVCDDHDAAKAHGQAEPSVRRGRRPAQGSDATLSR